MDGERNALLKLVLAGGAVANRRRLVDTHGGAAPSLAAGPSAWKAAGMTAAQVGRLRAVDGDMFARGCAWLERSHDHHLLGWNDPDFPPLLRNIASPPLALFIHGDPTMLWRPAVAVVGSRAPTAGGRDNAWHFGRALADAGVLVASGLAAGIDTAAHRGALAAPEGVTLAVLGTGIDVPYPAANAELMAEIARRGAVVSEHPPGTQPLRSHFPSRNRILAGLASAIMVIEAAQRSGALITARQAADAGREVMALPGSIHNPLARGCHRLIRDGASLVESPDEVLELMAPLLADLTSTLRSHLGDPISAASAVPAASSQALGPQTANHQRLWQAIDHAPTDMDRLVSRTGLTAAELSSMLLTMELEGRVVVEHGRYSRRR